MALARRSDIHLMRRFWHLFWGVIFLIGIYFSDVALVNWGYFSLSIALLGFLLDFLRLRNEEVNESLSKVFGPIMRKSEKLSFSGLPFYALGIALAIFLYDRHITILSIMFLVFADPIASITGVYFGRDRLLPNKTLQGTIAAFTVCLFISISYLVLHDFNSPNIIMFSFFGAIMGALSELLGAFNIDDNLTIPVVSGVSLTMINYWFQVL